MVRALRLLAWPMVFGVALMAGMGCPTSPPNYLPAYIVTPTSLDFGSDKDSLQFQVSKSYTSQPLPDFTIETGGEDWLSVSPRGGSSDGPNDPATFTVTVDRSEMDAGTHTATLRVQAPGVAEATVEVTASALLVADFSAQPLDVSVNENVQFTDESSVAPGQGQIISYQWSFGDGKQSTDRNPRHKYKNPGVYTVSLTVQTATLSDTAVKQNYITVGDGSDVVADFEASDTRPPAFTPVEFTDMSQPSQDIVGWFWSFGDSGTSTQQNPTHTYLTEGKFTVSLTVTTSGGQSDTETKEKYIRVQPVGPTAQFTANDLTPNINQQVLFSDLSDPGTSPITTWLWMFGDGASSNAVNPVHAYTAAGAYSVYLVVTTDVGSDTEFKQNYITVQP